MSVVHIGMAISNQIEIPNSAPPMNGALPRDRARSATLRFGRYSCVWVALLVAVCFEIIYSTSDGGCVITASPIQPGKTVAKTPVSILLEYCQKNKLKEPEYVEVPAQNGSGFSYVVTVKGNSYNGIVRTKKQEAKHSAAKVAIQQLGISKNVM